MSNQFTNRSIEQLAKRALDGKQCFFDIDIEKALFGEGKAYLLGSVSVAVEAFHEFKPVNDEVLVSLFMNRPNGKLSHYLDLEINEAERLGKLLIFQSKVARRAKEKKHHWIKKSKNG